ncbi:MAG TPA: GNVR domain-containing protein [Vicinamibacterales bacterium]|nr:GNVR domain-containing protein [Vicinamibacterales bacterium]
MMPGRRYTPASIWWIVRRRKWLLTAPLVLCFSGAAIVASQLKDRYRAQTLILVVPQRVPENYVRPAISENIEQRLASIKPQILSETRLERIVTELDLSPSKRLKKGGMEEIVADLRDDISIEVIKGDLFSVSYSGDDPYKVMQVTQRLASLFVQENLKDREQLVEGTSEFLESQLDRARRQLEEQERKVQEYRERHAGELPSQVGSNLQVLQTAAFQLQTLEEAMGRDRDRRVELERTLLDLTGGETPTKAEQKPTDAAATTGSASTATPPAGTPDLDAATASLTADVTARLAQLQTLQQALRGMELRLKPDHPDVVRTKRLIQQLQLSLDQDRKDRPAGEEAPDPVTLARRARVTQIRAQIATVDKEIARKAADRDRIKGVIATYQSRVESQPERESEMIALTRDYDTLKATYQNLLAKKEEASISANLERQQGSQQFKTLDPAKLPEKPYGPNRTLIIGVGAGAGFIFGLGLTVLLEVRDQTFRNALEVLPTLSLPVLASVPAIITSAERRRAKTLAVSVAFLAVTAIISGVIVAQRAGIIDVMGLFGLKWR